MLLPEGKRGSREYHRLGLRLVYPSQLNHMLGLRRSDAYPNFAPVDMAAFLDSPLDQVRKVPDPKPLWTPEEVRLIKELQAVGQDFNRTMVGAGDDWKPTDLFTEKFRALQNDIIRIPDDFYRYAAFVPDSSLLDMSWTQCLKHMESYNILRVLSDKRSALAVLYDTKDMTPSVDQTVGSWDDAKKLMTQLKQMTAERTNDQRQMVSRLYPFVQKTSQEVKTALRKIIENLLNGSARETSLFKNLVLVSAAVLTDLAEDPTNAELIIRMAANYSSMLEILKKFDLAIDFYNFALKEVTISKIPDDKKVGEWTEENKDIRLKTQTLVWHALDLADKPAFTTDAWLWSILCVLAQKMNPNFPYSRTNPADGMYDPFAAKKTTKDDSEDKDEDKEEDIDKDKDDESSEDEDEDHFSDARTDFLETDAQYVEFQGKTNQEKCNSYFSTQKAKDDWDAIKTYLTDPENRGTASIFRQDVINENLPKLMKWIHSSNNDTVQCFERKWEQKDVAIQLERMYQPFRQLIRDIDYNTARVIGMKRLLAIFRCYLSRDPTILARKAGILRQDSLFDDINRRIQNLKLTNEKFEAVERLADDLSFSVYEQKQGANADYQKRINNLEDFIRQRGSVEFKVHAPEEFLWAQILIILQELGKDKRKRIWDGVKSYVTNWNLDLDTRATKGYTSRRSRLKTEIPRKHKTPKNGKKHK